MMDLASGLCHYCTMGLPPEKLFSIHSNWMPWLKPSITDWGRQLLQEGLCSAREVVSIDTMQCQDRAVTWRQRATYCVETVSLWALCVGWSYSVFGPDEAMFCTYIYDALQHFSIFYRTTGVLPEWDNPCILHTHTHTHGHQQYSQAFYSRDISSSVFFCFVTTQFLGL